MKQTSTNSGVTFKKCLVIFLTVLGFSFSQSAIADGGEPYTCNGGRVTNLYFNELNGGADLPITNGSTFTVAQLGSLYNLEAGTSGTIGSVKYTISGPTATSNIENSTPYNSPGTGSGAWTGAVGNYSVNLKTYSGADGTGTLCHDTTITFILSNTTYNCNCPGNIILNPSFESGITSWSSSGGNLSAGNGAVACGSSSGDLENTSSSSKAWQNIGTNLAVGTSISATVYAGTHDNSFNNWVAIEFLNSSGTVLSSSVYVQVDKVLANSPAGPQQYTINASVPAGAVTTRVAFGGTGSYTKTDQWCVTLTPPGGTGSIGDRVWLDADGDGIQDASETGGITGVTVQLRNSANTVIATQNTNSTGNYLFTGLAAGTYTVAFPVSISGAVVTNANVGANDDIDSDPSQTTGITPNVTLAAGQSIVNVDAGYCPTTLQLGNRVFNDINNNGIDNTEAGISGATVNLYKDDNNDNIADGSSIATTTTNTTGNYTFSNLAPGNYIVGVVTPAGFVSSAINGGDPDNNTDLDDNGQVIVGTETRGLAINLVAGSEPNGDTNNTYDFGFFTNTPLTGERCFVSPTVPGMVWAKSTWTTNPAAGTVTIRTAFSKTFVDNTYGTNAIGWPGGHSFGNLTGSDKLGWSIKDANGVVKLAFEQDYISSSATFPSGYGTLGFGGDGGNPTVGTAADVTGFLTSIDKNLNQNGSSYYTVTTNSPATNNNYSPNATYPNWIYDVWYEVTVKLSAFGAAGFGYPDIATVHASPSKTGNNTEVVNPAPCIGSLGDFVWSDNNGNGIQEAGENGIQGVTVTLTKPDNTTVTTVTNASGFYQFTNLSAGTYSVSFPTTLAGGYGLTTANVGSDDSKDSDPAQGTGIASGVVLYPGQNNTTVDAGYVLSNLTLGNKVFFDLNRSGMYEGTDSLASGIIVRLYADANNDNIPDGALIQAMTTNALGEYSFANLAPGNYIVGAVIPPVHAITVINGGDPDNNLDNDNNAINNVSGEARGNSISLASGTEPTAGNTNNTYDIGFYNPTLPPNGGQNCFAGTNPVVYAKSFWTVNANSQTVTLRVTFSKKFVDNTYGTEAIGWPGGHTFGNLTGSDHLQWSIRDGNGVERLAFKQDYVSASTAFPSGYGCLGFGGDGGNPTVGSTTDVLSFRTSIATNFNDYGYVLTTNSPATDTNYTANPAQPNWIYDVWYEITVKASVFGTAGFGFVNVASVHASPSKTGNNTETITNTPCVSAIGDRVWYDTDRDGIQDAGENGIRGVTVKLRNSANVVIATQVTNTTGNYFFNNLQPGVYYVEFPVSVYGYKMSPAYVGANRNIDSDPSTSTGITPAINLGTADLNYTIDAGYAPDCDCVNSTSNLLVNPSFENGTTGWSWSGGTLTTGTGYVACGAANGFNNWSSGTSKVWQDVTVAAGSTVNFSAFAGTHAPGIACSPKLSLVFLNSANATISQTDVTVTRVVGDYNDQLEQYSITAVAPAGTVKVRVQSTITCNTMKLDAFCLIVTVPPVGSIGDRVWNDTDGDGIQDANEVGVAGVTVVLLNSAGQIIATTTTDAFGNYKFSGLPAGNYTLRVTPPANYSLSAKTQGGDTNVDSDFDPITYTTSTVTLAAGQNRTDIDAGLKFTNPQPASVGDRVWLDTNGDGVQDAGEPGVSNVLVTLYNSAGAPVRYTYTDVNGNYLFTDVMPGSYTVGFSLPPAFVFSPNNGAVSVANNSDAIPATGRTASFTVNAGDQITYVDAGIKSQVSTNGSIGDFVWNDLDKDGVQEAGEPGLAGVTVRLLNATTNAVIATTTTDATGKYIFNDVPAGDYKVEFVTPAGYTTTTKLNSNVAASGTDSDVDPATSRTATFSLAAGQRITTVDAGYWLTTGGTGKIGDRVWLDANQNGIQDAGEANVQGITVTLYDAANMAIKTTVTDANGNYLFTDLAAGNYTVGFSNIPQGFTFTTQGLGTAATGSDANPATGRTGTITLAAGQTNLDVDAGIRSMMAGTASIGNRVWNDLNNNGLQDAGEPGIQGVTVELLDAAGNPIDSDPVTPGVQPTTRVTNALGEYLFTGLAAGDYRVRFSTLPAGYNASPKGAGANRDIDSDGNPIAGGTSTTDVVSVASGEERLDIDLGLYNPTAPIGQLGDRVWFDSNNNGVQDGGEQGVPGVTVSLLNASNTVLATTVTDANGEYRFVNLADATYSVKFSNLPAGFVFSPKDLGGNDNTDSDADPVTGQTGTYTIAGGNTNLTVDGGIYSTRAALGDYVWFDADSDGTQDATEKGIAGITVTLYDAANVAVTSAITDQNGRYFFSNLNPGTYTVGFSTIPTKLAFTLKDVVAAGDAADSDVDPATGKTGPVTLTAGQVNLTVDAGLKPVVPATVGDFVWYDDNANGIQDPGEGGVPGVIVTLYNSANQPIGSAITDGNGAYLISNVPPGTGYYVRFSNQPDPSAPWTLQNVGGVGANNNSKADVTGQSTPFNVAEGQNITNMDAGLVRLGSIGDRVWNDTDGDGIQDANEVGVAGVTVVLLNSAGQIIATTTTDAFGNYKFSGLPAGNYTLRVTPPANYSLSAKTQGGDTNLDSDFDPITYTTSTVTLAAGQNRTDIDAGLKFTNPQPASVGDRVWLDTNGDGVQDAGEPGVSNVLVTLYNSAGAPVRYTYTDVNGNYLFTDVMPGSYTVGFSLPPAFVFSPNNGAVSVANNSDAIPATGRTASFTVNAGDQITYVDAGIKSQVSTNGSIGDFVWNDLDKDGVQEAGEPGIAGVTVRLVNATTNTVVATTITDAAGKYIFNDLPAGDYKVEFVTPAGYTTTTRLSFNPQASNTDSDVDAATSRTATFTLNAGQRIVSVDAGYWQTTGGTGKIGDRVWLDANQNGVQDAGETNVQGITVTLYDAANMAIKTTVTDANGNYLFTDLAAGNYTVGFSNIPQGFTFTTQGLGTAATGSDANPATGRTGTITLAAGQTNLDVDAGIRSMMAGTASIGNRVWNDLNNNGLQDAGEPGIQGVTVELLDAAGNPIDSDPVTPGVQPTTRVTNALGEYLFTGLAAGDYRVRFSTLPAGYNASPKGAGANRDIDSDGNPIAGGTSTTDIVSVASGEERLDIDLGLYNPTAPIGQLGDRVWFDSNNNGVQDGGEQGVPGVTVSLLNASNTVLATTVTDANGEYRFVNLADATYSVKFSNLPAGFVFSPKDLGGNDNTDSDADPVTGQTGTYTIAGGNTNLTVDGGIYSTRAALGDYVWFDADSDGTQDATEKGIAGITVTLYDAANVAVTSAITDQNGRYFFSNLNPGTYTVGFSTIPTKLAFTLKDVVAAGDAADSDVDPATGKTGPVTLTAGQVNLTVDAGLKPVVPASLGDFVWYDLDRDGLQDAGEPGVPGVIATLYNAANQPIGSAITDGNGYYHISNVPPGTGYYVRFSNKPDPIAPWTLQNVGGAGASDNSKADATGQTLPLNVAEGQNITNVDAGLFRILNLSGNVWHDVNGMLDSLVNNTRGDTAAAIPAGLKMILVDANTSLVVRTTLVQGNGFYNFPNIDPGTYILVLKVEGANISDPSPFASIPDGWRNTGERLGLNLQKLSPLNDGGPAMTGNGKLTVSIINVSVTNANFGINFGGDFPVN